MNKKLISIFAAAAVAASCSSLCANALYTEVISKQDHSGYTKFESRSSETVDVYISNEKSNDSDAPYRRDAIREEKKNDRIYFNINDGVTLSDIGGLTKQFVTENGDKLQVCENNMSNKQYEYYITPAVFKENEPLKRITANDARQIKEILTKDNSATDLLYTTDVCTPQRGSIDISLFNYITSDKRDDEEAKDKAEESINQYISENKIDFTVENLHSAYGLRIVPNYDISFEEHLEIIEQICKISATYPFNLWQTSASEDFSGVDLFNAIDGDSNCDEQLDMADAVMIMQALANPNKYSISAQGSFNADLNGDGLTVGDAQAIQKVLLGLE